MYATSQEEGTAPSRFDDQLSARLLHQRIVVLQGEVNDVSAGRATQQLMLLSSEDPRRDVLLCINSPGGSVTAGMALYDTMQAIPNDVATLAMGFAASMGQTLLCAGTAGKRYALPHARVMMHQPSAGLGGTAIDIAIQAENLEFTKRVMQELTALHTGQSVETIARDSDRDRWFTAAEARDYGMVDEVVTSLDDVRPSTRSRAGLGV